MPSGFTALGATGKRAVLLKVGVRDAADMPELKEDPAALRMDGIGHLLPPRHLSFAVDAGRIGVALALTRDLGRLADDQAGGRALPVIFGVEFIRGVVLVGAAAGQRRHDDAVGQSVQARV